MEREFAKLDVRTFEIDEVIEEGSEESEDESSEELSTNEARENVHKLNETSQNQMEPSDYIQAFTHFTYLFTNRQAMVCDLQGVYNSDMIPPVFELTDPAIHYKSKSGKSNVFGRTDAGEAGMDLFFKTHRCSQVCKWMQLSRNNKNWKKAWKFTNH